MIATKQAISSAVKCRAPAAMRGSRFTAEAPAIRAQLDDPGAPNAGREHPVMPMSGN